MEPTTREELKQRILRELGDPVIEINVADEQVEDQIDTALGKGYWGGMELYGIKHQLFRPQPVSEIQNRELVWVGSLEPWEVPPPRQKWR